MTRHRHKNSFVIFFVSAGVLILIFSVGSSFSALKKNFHTELAKRLETEETMLKMEHERLALVRELDKLKKELINNKTKIEALNSTLTQERADREGLMQEIEKLKTQGKT